MAKYDVIMSCGHEEVVELFGKAADRKGKIEYFKLNGLCKECYKKKMNEERKEAGLNFNATVLPSIDESDGEILLFVWFDGDTMPYKDQIKAIGGYRWGERASADDLLSFSRPPLCWNKIVKAKCLKEEIDKALSIGAKNLISDQGLFLMANYQIAIKKQNKWIEEHDKISKLKTPDVPNILIGHRWNQKVYGKSDNYTIYLDNVKTEISNEQKIEIENYLKQIDEYNKKVNEIKK